MFLLGLLLVLFSTASAKKVHTKFHISGDVWCSFDFGETIDFLHDVKVIEKDFILVKWFDDDIGIPGTLNITRPYKDAPKKDDRLSVRYEIDAEADGDELAANNYYVYVKIQHECTKDGRMEWREKLIVPVMGVETREYWPTLNINIHYNKREADGLRFGNIQVKKIE